MILAGLKTLVRAFTILCFFCFLFVLPVQAGDETDPNPFNLPERVMAMPKELRSGQVFQGYPQLSAQVKWYSIPSGLAGDWISKSQRVLRKDDFESGSYYTIPTVEHDTVVVHLGDMTDANGGVWHALISPEIQDYQKQQFLDSQNTISIKMLEQSANHVLIWSRVFHIIYNPQNYRIFSSFTEERVRQFEILSSTRLVCRSYLRLYDAEGYVQMSAQTLRTFSLQKKYQPLNERSGINLPSSLASHLQYIGHHDLISW
tara:strand:+ start:576 stop:1352 length:777 start_codon:yes stop_codon:yes gene_type:complete